VRNHRLAGWGRWAGTPTSTPLIARELGRLPGRITLLVIRPGEGRSRKATRPRRPNQGTKRTNTGHVLTNSNGHAQT
jgi:hypothetical protein